MSFTFRPAVREQIRLLLALSGGTGSGKSYTALRLAKGLANGKRFAAIDTENGRLSMYADFFSFDVLNLEAPFTPARYLEAVLAAEKAGYEVILIDSGSHAWDGDGGVLDMQEEELAAMVDRSKSSGDNRPDWQIEEAHRMRSWIHPKIEHKHMMTGLLQLRAHVIMCLRAAEKIEIAKETYKDSGGREKTKTIVRPKQSLTGLDGWIPICESKLPFEFTASFLLTADKPGVPKPIKLQEQHKAFFPLDRPITEECGQQIGEWAKGGAANKAAMFPPTASGAATAQPGPLVTETSPGVYEPKPELVAKKWFMRIEQSPTIDMLKEIGKLLKDAPLSAEDKATARDLYTARMRQLKEKEAVI